MKQIIAKPAVLERVTEALRHIEGLTGMSVIAVLGEKIPTCNRNHSWRE